MSDWKWTRLVRCEEASLATGTLYGFGLDKMDRFRYHRDQNNNDSGFRIAEIKWQLHCTKFNNLVSMKYWILRRLKVGNPIVGVTCQWNNRIHALLRPKFASQGTNCDFPVTRNLMCKHYSHLLNISYL